MSKVKDNTTFSRYLSYILRHKPESIGLKLTSNGYVSTYQLLDAIRKNTGYDVDLNRLKEIVSTDEKQRYSFKEMHGDKYALIRANQGHSIKELNLEFKEVTEVCSLYHGTSEENAKKIMECGELKPMSRQMVHLSGDLETAIKVGSRHGKPKVFKVNMEKAISEGIKFYISENGVYLTPYLKTHLLEEVV